MSISYVQIALSYENKYNDKTLVILFWRLKKFSVDD